MTFKMSRFDKALHPDVKRSVDQGAPWIKSFTGQLDDPDYISLGASERGLLNDLRLLAARRNNKLPLDPTRLAPMLRLGAPSRISPALDKLAAHGFIQRTDGQAWQPLHAPKPRRVRAATNRVETDASRVDADQNSEATEDEQETPAQVDEPQAPRLRLASAEVEGESEGDLDLVVNGLDVTRNEENVDVLSELLGHMAREREAS